MYADVDFEPSCCLTLPERTESLSAAMDMSLINPAILSPEEFAMSAGQAKDDRFAGVSIKDEAEAVGEKVVSKDLDTSLHGTYRHHAKQRLAEGFYREEYDLSGAPLRQSATRHLQPISIRSQARRTSDSIFQDYARARAVR